MAKARERDWAAEAWALPGDDYPLAVPLHVTLGEPIDVAAFLEKYWAKTAERPGLEQVATTLPRATGDEITQLQHPAIIREVTSAYERKRRPAAPTPSASQRIPPSGTMRVQLGSIAPTVDHFSRA